MRARAVQAMRSMPAFKAAAMSKPTQHWRRRIKASDQPAYRLIADLIAEDLRTGRLAARDRLPTLRELADELGLNYTTVARAYAGARKARPDRFAPGHGHARARPCAGAAAARRQCRRDDHEPAARAGRCGTARACTTAPQN